MTVRELTADDAPWAAELMEQRRQEYAHYSPELLLAAWQRLSAGGTFDALRVVTAHADEAKSALLIIPASAGSPRAAELPKLGFSVASDWYLGQLAPS